MKGQFVENVNELSHIIHSIFQSGNGFICPSKIFPNYNFWNIVGNENTAEFPTIYWSKELENEVKNDNTN